MRRLGVLLLVVMAMLVSVLGCRTPVPGTKLHNSGVGISLKPLGDMPQGPKLQLGSFVSSYSTPPADNRPDLGRVQIRAPLGVDHTDTVASGPVGEELAKGGEGLVKVIQTLHPNNKSTLVPFELPVNLPKKDEAKPSP